MKRVEGVKGKYYPADDIKVNKGPVPVRNPTKIRASITPGTVLILVAGRFAGKRAVCLKVLSSGLLLVSGITIEKCADSIYSSKQALFAI